MKRYMKFIAPATQIAYPLMPLEEHIHEQLIDKSQEPTIVQSCPDDSKRRFTNTEAFQKWSREVATIMFLYLTNEGLQSDGCSAPDLAAVVFYRNKHHPASKSNMTMGIRVYDGARGSGLGKYALEDSYQSIEELRNSKDRSQIRDEAQWLCDTRGVWLSVDRENHRAYELYHSLGYITVSKDLEKNRDIMEYYRRDE